MTFGRARRSNHIFWLNEALSPMEQVDPQSAKVTKLGFFGGLMVEETASALYISSRTVKDDWKFARAWPAKELSASR